MMMILLPLTMLMTINSWYLSILSLPCMLIVMSIKLTNCYWSYTTYSSMLSTDTFSLLMIMVALWITTLMMLSSMKISAQNNKKNSFHFIIMSLLLILIFTFSVNNMFFYYIFFEASLIPTLLLILMWGYQPERLQAGMYMMLYTISMSFPFLISVIALYYSTTSISFYIPSNQHQFHIIFKMAMSFAFLVKLPMYSMHLWLPKAHVEAPIAGSMILAGVLLKLGGYGLMRISMMQPSVLSLSPIIMAMSLWGGMLTSILCMRQIDMKSMIAYSSVTHMALVITGIYSNSIWGWEGAILMMIAHALSSSGLFSLANMYYENTNTRSLFISKGMLFISPSMTMWWMMLITTNMAGPPTINLLSEILLLSSAMFYSHLSLPFLFMISFFTVAYSLILFTSLHHGPPSEHLNYFKINQLHFTISLMHITPLFLMITCPSYLTSNI